MALSIREQIFEAIETLIKAIDGIGEVNRGQGDALTVYKWPAVFIYGPNDSVNTEYVGTLLDRRLEIQLFIWTNAQTNVDKGLEEIIAKVQAAMLADYTFGGLTIDVNEQYCNKGPVAEELPDAGAVISYAVQYRVNRTNPYSMAA